MQLHVIVIMTGVSSACVEQRASLLAVRQAQLATAVNVSPKNGAIGNEGNEVARRGKDDSDGMVEIVTLIVVPACGNDVHRRGFESKLASVNSLVGIGRFRVG